MQVQALPPQEIVRRAVIEVASLPEKDLVLVIEFVADLKQSRTGDSQRPSASEILARARQRAAEMASLPREEVFARFMAAAERIRAQAVANGTAIEGDWEGD